MPVRNSRRWLGSPVPPGDVCRNEPYRSTAPARRAPPAHGVLQCGWRACATGARAEGALQARSRRDADRPASVCHGEPNAQVGQRSVGPDTWSPLSTPSATQSFRVLPLHPAWATQCRSELYAHRVAPSRTAYRITHSVGSTRGACALRAADMQPEQEEQRVPLPRASSSTWRCDAQGAGRRC